jgi:hypothetical protein
MPQDKKKQDDLKRKFLLDLEGLQGRQDIGPYQINTRWIQEGLKKEAEQPYFNKSINTISPDINRHKSVEDMIMDSFQKKKIPIAEQPIGTIEWNDGPGENAFKKPPIETMEKPIGTIEWNQDGTIKAPPIQEATPMDRGEVQMNQRHLNTVGFNLKEDGEYGSKTATADSMYNAYGQKGFDDDYIKNINYAKKQGYPAHLLEDGNEELYNKWKDNKKPLSDAEYKQVFPDAKTNAQILKNGRQLSQNLFDKIFKNMK